MSIRGRPSSPGGFSLGELLVTMGLIAVAILSLMALSILMARADREGVDTKVGDVVAGMLVERLLDQVRADNPAGTAANFWDNDFDSSNPYEEGDYRNNNTEYHYQIFAVTVRTTGGAEVGDGTTGNRLKKVDVIVNWWDTQNQDREGYGKLEVRNSRLISEGET